jgi:O-antigen ligase
LYIPSSLRHWLEKNTQLWQRIGIVAGVLTASAYLARRPSPRFILLPLGAGAVLAFMRWPLLGFVALIAGDLAIPFAVGTGTQTEIHAGILLLALLIGLWVLDMLQRKEIRLADSRTTPPLIVFVIIVLLSFGMGQLPWFATPAAPFKAQIGGVAIFVLSASAFLLAGHRMQNIRWLEVITWVFLAVGGLYIAGRLTYAIGRYTERLFTPGMEGSLFWTWLMALAFSQAMFNTSLKTRWRLVLGGLVLATMYVAMVFGWDWNSGWAPRIGALMTVAGGLAGITRVQEIWDALMVGDNQYSLMTRLEAWRILGEIIRVNPILGLGPANYYWYTPLFPILGYAVSFNSHNNYVDLAAQTGLLGTACFLWFAWQVGRLGWRLLPKIPAGFEKAYVIGALGGLAGTLAAGMFGDWFLPFVYNIGISGFRASMLGWFFLGGLVALERFHRQALDQ